MVDLAQLARARGCGPRGRGFESRNPPVPLRAGVAPAVALSREPEMVSAI